MSKAKYRLEDMEELDEFDDGRVPCPLRFEVEDGVCPLVADDE